MSDAGGSIEQRVKDLLFEMKVTKGSRFNAAVRLNKRDQNANRSAAYASVGVIVLTVFPMYFHLGEFWANSLNILTVMLSLAILAASLTQYSSADPVRAEQHHRCALELNALRRELRAQGSVSEDELKVFSKNYDNILQRYSINHEPVDFDRYKREHPLEYPGEEVKNTVTSGSREAFEGGPAKIASLVTGALIAALFSSTALSERLWIWLSSWFSVR